MHPFYVLFIEKEAFVRILSAPCIWNLISQTANKLTKFSDVIVCTKVLVVPPNRHLVWCIVNLKWHGHCDLMNFVLFQKKKTMAGSSWWAMSLHSVPRSCRRWAGNPRRWRRPSRTALSPSGRQASWVDQPNSALHRILKIKMCRLVCPFNRQQQVHDFLWRHAMVWNFECQELRWSHPNTICELGCWWWSE